MVKNILLINVHSSRNVGDAALTQVALEQLQRQFPDSNITLVMNDPQSHLGQEKTVNSFYNWVYKYNKWQAIRFTWLTMTSLISIFSYRLSGKTVYTTFSEDLHETLEALINADLVVGTPGGYLYSYDRGRALILFSFTMTLALLAGKPLYLLPQSIGPFKFKRDYFLVKWPLSRARAVMVRESKSLELINKIGVPKSRCYLLPDMAFAFHGESQSNGQEWLQSQGINPNTDRPLLGLTVIDWEAQYQSFTDQKNFEEAIAATIRYFVNRFGGKVLIFPQCLGPTMNEDDRLPARRILSKVNDISSSVRVIETPISPGLLKSVYGQMDLFIGTRMHSNIFAISQGVPVLAIGYLHKTLGIAQTVGIKNWVLDIQEIDDKQLIKKLNDLWVERHHVRAHLEKITPKLVEHINQTGVILAEDYAQIRKVGEYE